MSYQAITDIIVNTGNPQNLQLSNTVDYSQKTTADNSFSELVSYYKNENSSETREASVKDSPAEEKIPEKKDDSSKEEKKIESEQKVLLPDDDKLKKVEKKSDDKKSVNSETLSSGKKKTPDKSEKSDSKEKKLSKKDFSRIEQFTDTKQNSEEVSKSALNIQNQKNKLPELKNQDENISEAQNISSQTMDLSKDFAISTGSETETQDFCFNQKEPEAKEKFSLDKDGKITVQDLRTKEAEEIILDKKSDLKITEIKKTGENSAVMTIDLNQNVNSDVLSLNNQTASANGSNFQAMLNNQIQNSAPEFVKAGNLILKDNNQGTINLVLHPDDLGNVKIHLSLDGKSVSGQITVATREALQVFKDNAETLREAFVKNGFDAANFDVAFANNGAFNQDSHFSNQNDGSDLFARNVYKNNSEALDSELETVMKYSEDISNYSVNIVA